tara:strand:- start:110 stop:784 length:675 start_codon:yes stop_codon:yes gene_type:complete
MAKGLIYKATNKINGKSYVGQTTKTVDTRKNGHIESVNKDSDLVFHRAIRKYGEDNFIWETLCKCNDIDELNEKEIFYIDKYNTFGSGYNMTEGGGGVTGLRFNLSEEVKEKISKLAKERFSVPENNPMYGKHHSEETRKKWSEIRKGRFTGEENSFYGKKHSEESLEKMRISTLKQFENGMPGETKKKISESTKGIPTSEETRKKMSEARKRYWENKKLQEVK